MSEQHEPSTDQSRIRHAGINVPMPGWCKSAISWIAGLPVAVLALVSAFIFAGFVGFLLFVGFVLGHRDIFPASFFEKVDGKLASILVGEQEIKKLSSTSYNSALIRLNAEVGIVPTGRVAIGSPLSQNGGGITQFGDEILVLPYNGTIYAATGPNDIRATKLVGPENNRAAYVAEADDPANADFHFVRTYLRYNDLSYFETPTARGLLASYIEYHPGKLCVTNNVARLDIDPSVTSIDQVEASASDWKVVYRTKPCLPFKTRMVAMEGHMSGGRMLFEAPSTLYLTSGDFHNDGMRSDGAGIAQDPVAEYGKVMQIDIDTGEGRIVSMGHRNMQGITRADNGNLMVIEHGPRGGDEINWIKEGQNYGWPLESYGTTYAGTPMPNSLSYGRQTQFETPVFSWIPSLAVSSVTTIKGFHPSWDGDLLVCSLSDQSINRVRMEGDRAVYSERIEIGTRIRDVLQAADGRLVLWTDNSELIFLTGEDRIDANLMFERYLSRSELTAGVENKLRIVADGCAECHSYVAGENENAPSLGRIFGQDIASSDYEGYSDALQKVRGTWTREALRAYLQDPQGFAPGTNMPTPNIADEKALEAMIDYLEDLDNQF